MYIDKNKNGDIVALYAKPQREGHEYLKGAKLPPSPTAAITELEATITPRRLREAVLSQEGADWLAEVDAQISALRG